METTWRSMDSGRAFGRIIDGADCGPEWQQRAARRGDGDWRLALRVERGVDAGGRASWRVAAVSAEQPGGMRVSYSHRYADHAGYPDAAGAMSAALAISRR